MFANFLPPSVVDIQDLETIAYLHQLSRRVIQVQFEQGPTAMAQPLQRRIATAYIHHSPSQSVLSSNACPILLLHGFDSSLLEFRRLLPLVARSYETWALDLFGFGFTEYVSSLAVNPQTIRQHLLSFVKTQICQPVILVGASMGGAVAIDFALHYSRWVQSLVLINSVGFSGSLGSLLMKRSLPEDASKYNHVNLKLS